MLMFVPQRLTNSQFTWMIVSSKCLSRSIIDSVIAIGFREFSGAGEIFELRFMDHFTMVREKLFEVFGAKDGDFGEEKLALDKRSSCIVQIGRASCRERVSSPV